MRPPVLVALALGLLLAALLAVAGADGRPSASPGRGGLIAFVSDRSVDKQNEIYAIGADGRGRVNLTRHENPDLQPTPSPDGTKIAFTREFGHFELYVMAADGSGQRHLARGNRPAWSSDAGRIAYIRDRELRVVDVTGSGDRLLASGEQFDATPAWSPDGTRIAFTRVRGPNHELVVMGTDGGGEVVLDTRPSYVALPFAWTAGSDEVVFPVGGNALRALRPDGSGARTALIAPGGILRFALGPDDRVAAVVFADERYVLYASSRAFGQLETVDAGNALASADLAWSGDGRLAYTRGREIGIVQPPGAFRRFIPDSGAGDVTGLRWLGDRVLYSAAANRGHELYTAEVRSGAIRRLTNDSWDDITPAWSPDGSQLAFASNRDGDYEIYVMTAAGGRVRQITRNRFGEADPTWAPDGTRLAFARRGRIYVANADGSGPARLLTRGRRRGADPDWSPDGTRIAFVAPDDGIGRLAVMSADGTNTRFIGISLNGGSLGQLWPDWSPDGTRVAATDLMDGGCDTYERARLSGPGARLTPPPCVGLVLFKPTGGIAASYYNRDHEYDSPAWSPDGSRIAVAGFDSFDRRGRHRRLLRGWHDGRQLDWQPVCSIRGDARAGTLRGGAGADVICALAGADRIAAGSRHDVVYGGPGDDVIDGGSGRDWLFGAAGADRMLARDSQADVVDCGPGRDSVVADAVDRVGSDCERVARRR